MGRGRMLSRVTPATHTSCPPSFHHAPQSCHLRRRLLYPLSSTPPQSLLLSWCLNDIQAPLVPYSLWSMHPLLLAILLLERAFYLMSLPSEGCFWNKQTFELETLLISSSILVLMTPWIFIYLFSSPSSTTASGT